MALTNQGIAPEASVTDFGANAAITVLAHPGTYETIDEYARQWRELCERKGHNAPFYRPEWIRAYVRSFVPNLQLLLVTAYSGRQLKAVLPLVYENRRLCGVTVRKLRGAANVNSCRFDLITADGPERDDVIAAVWRFLSHLPDWDILELPEVPQAGAAEQLLGYASENGFRTAQVETVRSPYIPLTGVRDAMAIGRSAHFRQNLRRRLRRISPASRLRLQHFRTVDDRALNQFFMLESSGWKGREGTAIASSPATLQFFREVAVSAEKDSYFALYLLMLDDVAIAGHFGLIYNGHYYCPKIAYDERYGQHGPGHLIMLRILEESLKAGLTEFDFLGPSMPWKEEWTAHVRPHSTCYVFNQGVGGELFYSLHAANSYVIDKLRAAARRLGIAPVRQLRRWRCAIIGATPWARDES